MRKNQKPILISLFILSPYLLYLTILNFALSTHLVPHLVSEGEGQSFNLSYKFAWTLYPGNIQIHGLHLNGTDPNVEWNVYLSHASLRIRLGELLDQKLHVRKMLASDVQVDLLQHRRPKPPEDGAPKKKSPWTFHIAGIILDDVNDLKIGGMHIETAGKITGEFTLKPGQYLELPAGQLLIENGKLHLGREKPKPVLADIQAKNLITIHPTDLTATKGDQIFDTMDIEQEMRAKILSAEFLALALKDYRPLLFGTSEGTLKTKLIVDHGVLQNESFMDAQLIKTELIFSGAAIDGKGSLVWNIDKTAQMTFQLDQALWKDGKGKELAHTEHFKILGTSRSLKLPQVFSDLALKLEIKDTTVGSLQRLLKHLMGYQGEKSLLLESKPGRFTLLGNIVPSKSDFNGTLVYDAPEFKWSHDGGKTILQSYLKTEFKVSSKNYTQGKFNFDEANLKFSSLKIISEGKEEYSTDQWEMKNGLKNGEVAMIGPFQLEGDLQIGMTNAKVPARYAAPESFWMPIALFFFPMKHFNGVGKLSVKPDRFSLTEFKSGSSSGKLSVDLVSLEDETQGAVLLQLAPLTACIMIDPKEKTKVEVNDAQEKCQKQTQEVRQKL